MKIKASDLAAMRAACERVIATSNYVSWIAANPQHSQKRIRWDVLHASRYDVCALYSYLDDSHIDTALRSIFGHKA